MLNELKSNGGYGFYMILQGNRLAERYLDEDDLTTPSIP